MKKTTSFILAVLIISSFTGLITYAAVPIDPDLYPGGAATISGDTPKDAASQQREYQTDSARAALSAKVVNIVTGIAAVIAIFFVINSAFTMVISAGNDEKVTEAKKGLLWALVGLLLITLSYAIIRFVIMLPVSSVT